MKPIAKVGYITSPKAYIVRGLRRDDLRETRHRYFETDLHSRRPADLPRQRRSRDSRSYVRRNSELGTFELGMLYSELTKAKKPLLLFKLAV